MRYPVKIEQDGEGWFASVPAIPEALTSGPSAEAAGDGQDALITSMDFYLRTAARALAR